VDVVLVAEATILFVLHPRRMETLVLVTVIIALLASSAFQRDEFAWHLSSLLS
jgi:hypothetical protein